MIVDERLDLDIFSMAFYPIRRAVPADANAAVGVELDPLQTVGGARPAMALVHRNWSAIYFVLKRAAWSEAEYFEYAAQRHAALGITEP
jgi:hypothetical protein